MHKLVDRMARDRVYDAAVGSCLIAVGSWLLLLAGGLMFAVRDRKHQLSKDIKE